ncbi:MAG: hypothetical protein GX328_05850 [Clostridiaceae bacterium]|nr:hypothetical protein [Clostridiaceae bacterium]
MEIIKGYKVIEIMNEKEILINYGYVDGAQKGDKVAIYIIGEPVTDPESGNSLGTFDAIKDELEIVSALEKFSVCRKYRSVSPLIKSFSAIMNPLTATKTESIPLDVNKEQISGREWKVEPTINLNDLVMIIKE